MYIILHSSIFLNHFLESNMFERITKEFDDLRHIFYNFLFFNYFHILNKFDYASIIETIR